MISSEELDVFVNELLEEQKQKGDSEDGRVIDMEQAES